MRRLFDLAIFIIFLLIFMSAKSYCHAADSKVEMDWDYLTPSASDRDLHTVSLHILKKISETNNRSAYRGITITRPYGDIILNQQLRESSAIGVGPVYLIRNERHHSGKLSVASI